MLQSTSGVYHRPIDPLTLTCVDVAVIVSSNKMVPGTSKKQLGPSWHSILDNLSWTFWTLVFLCIEGEYIYISVYLIAWKNHYCDCFSSTNVSFTTHDASAVFLTNQFVNLRCRWLQSRGNFLKHIRYVSKSLCLPGSTMPLCPVNLWEASWTFHGSSKYLLDKNVKKNTSSATILWKWKWRFLQGFDLSTLRWVVWCGYFCVSHQTEALHWTVERTV